MSLSEYVRTFNIFTCGYKFCIHFFKSCLNMGDKPQDILRKRHPLEHQKSCNRAGFRKTGKLPGSYTVEASVVLPVYLCLCVVAIMFFNVITTQWKTQVSINEIVRKTSVIADPGGGGSPDVLIIRSHTLPIPVGMFGRASIRTSQQAKCRRWVGWDPHEFDNEDNITVYVAETGRVYHRSRSCTYLNPSVKAVKRSSVEDFRNSGGGRYRRCPLCGRIGGSSVYITTYGDAYHSSRTCSGLKRTIYTMKLKEARQKYPGCSKCSK